MGRPNEEDTMLACWRWVAREIAYPAGRPYRMDRHQSEAFLAPGLIANLAAYRDTVYDYWAFPAETLALRTGDCEDAAILIVSLLRNFLPEDRVFVTAGLFTGVGGHAWVTVVDENKRFFVLEATLTDALPSAWLVPEEAPYEALVRFNDVVMVELGEVPPGLLDKKLSLDTTLREVSRFYRGFGVAGKVPCPAS